MKKFLTIGISSRDRHYYEQLLESVALAVRKLENWQVETILSIGGADSTALANEGRKAGAPYPALNLKVIERSPECIAKPAAVNEICEQAKGDLILLLDDDIKLSQTVIKNAIDQLMRQPDVLLVSSQQKIIRPIPGGWWRNFIYDVINIQQIADVFDKPDPFIFGRFMLIRKTDLPSLPENVLNDDMYIQALVHPHELKISDHYEYTGITRLLNHYRRVFRIMDGRVQIKKLMAPQQLNAYSRKPQSRRILDWAKIRKLPPYLFFCFMCYRLVRGSTYLLKPSFYRRTESSGWERTT